MSSVRRQQKSPSFGCRARTVYRDQSSANPICRSTADPLVDSATTLAWSIPPRGSPQVPTDAPLHHEGNGLCGGEDRQGGTYPGLSDQPRSHRQDRQDDCLHRARIQLLEADTHNTFTVPGA